MEEQLEELLVSCDEYISVQLEKQLHNISREIKPIAVKEYTFSPMSVYNEMHDLYTMTNHEEFDDLMNQIVEENSFLEKYQPLLIELAINALDHGNKYDPNKTLSISIAEGQKGWIMSIKDDGEGFDFKETLKNGFFTHEGCGLRKLKEKCSENPLSFSYQEQGRQINVYTL